MDQLHWKHGVIFVWTFGEFKTDPFEAWLFLEQVHIGIFFWAEGGEAGIWSQDNLGQLGTGYETQDTHVLYVIVMSSDGNDDKCVYVHENLIFASCCELIEMMMMMMMMVLFNVWRGP